MSTSHLPYILSINCQRHSWGSEDFTPSMSRAYFIINSFCRDKQRFKREDTLYNYWIFPDTEQFVVFPAECQSLRQTFDDSGCIIWETSSLLLLLVCVWSSIPKMLQGLTILPSILGYLVLRKRDEKHIWTRNQEQKSLFTHGRK